MPRGAKPGEGRTANAIAASALARHDRMLASIATGKKWCPQGGGHWGVLADFGPSQAKGSGLRGWCHAHENEYARDRYRAKRAAAAEAASAATRAATQARAWEAERARWAARDPVPAAEGDIEMRTLIVAVRFRLGVGDADAARIARLVTPRSTVSRGPVPGRALDVVESFALLDDRQGAALARQAGVKLPELRHRRRRAA